MNLVKINKSITEYINTVKDFVPDVYSTYKLVGKDMMGRAIYFGEEIVKGRVYFNKSIIHKEKDCYVGENKNGYYAQDIVEFKDEERCLCIKGNCDKYQEFGDQLVKKIGTNNFVFDVGFIDGKMFLVEINEIHLSSIDSKQLQYILQNIL